MKHQPSCLLCAGFYAAASKQFANVRQVKVYTFASPLVGTTSFLQAYQHLERCGKLRHARFSCSGDMVPTVPFCNFDGFKFWNWKCYRHAGMKIRLGAGPLTKWKLRRALDVTYPLKSDWFTQIRRMCLDNILVNLTTVSGMKRNHTLTEYQKRLNLASQYRLALGKSGTSNCMPSLMAPSSLTKYPMICLSYHVILITIC